MAFAVVMTGAALITRSVIEGGTDRGMFILVFGFGDDGKIVRQWLVRA